MTRFLSLILSVHLFMENGITPFHLKKKVEQVIYAQLLSAKLKPFLIIE